MDVIASGKPIFVEKPITFTAEEAEKIMEAVEKAGLYLQVGFMRRFDPGHVAAKKMIESGACGKPIYIHDCQRDPNGPRRHMSRSPAACSLTWASTISTLPAG